MSKMLKELVGKNCCFTLTNGQKVLAKLLDEKDQYYFEYPCEVYFAQGENGLQPALQPWQPFTEEKEKFPVEDHLIGCGSIIEEGICNMWKEFTEQPQILTPSTSQIIGIH